MKRMARPWLSAQVLAALALALGGLHAANRPAGHSPASPPRSGPARLLSGEQQPPSFEVNDEAAPPRRLEELPEGDIAADGIAVPAPEESDHLLAAGRMPRPTDTQPTPRQLLPQPSSAAGDDASPVELAAPRRLAPRAHSVSETSTPALKPASPTALDRLKPTPIHPRPRTAADPTLPADPLPVPSAALPTTTPIPLDPQPLAAPGALANGPAPVGPTTTPSTPATASTTPSPATPAPATPALTVPSPEANASGSKPTPAEPTTPAAPTLVPPTTAATPAPALPPADSAAKPVESAPATTPDKAPDTTPSTPTPPALPTPGPTLVAPEQKPATPPEEPRKADASTTDKPVASNPETIPPTTDKPVSDKPASEKPATNKPTAESPSADKAPATAAAPSLTAPAPVVPPKLAAPTGEATQPESALPTAPKADSGPALAPPLASPDSGGSSKGNTEPKNVPAITGPMPPGPMPTAPALPPVPPVDAEKPSTPAKAPNEKSTAPSDNAKPTDPRSAEGTPTDKPGADKPASDKPATDKPAADKPVAETPAPEPRDPLLNLVDQAIQVTSQRQLRAGVNSPWQIVHGVVAMRWDMQLQSADGKGSVSAIEWLMGGNKFEGQPLWQATQWGGRGHPYTRPYAHEGHPTQFLGYMTMANIPLDYEVQADTKIITVRDIINDAKMSVRQGPEITWTLWALSHYEEPDAQWYNSAGEAWSIERLVKMQVDEQVTRGACGGCHGLFALCYARNIYLTQGRQLRGVWMEADNKIKTYAEYSRRMQNRDGSFSSNFYKSPGFTSDFSSRLNTTGHQLEWIMVALPQSRLREQWVRNAVECLSRDLIINARNPSDTGPMYHSLHSLILYRQRLDPNYLIPKRNSPLKLNERGRAEPIANLPGIPQASTTPAKPSAATVPVANSTPKPEGLRPATQPAPLKAVPVPRTLPRASGSASPVDGRDIDAR